MTATSTSPGTLPRPSRSAAVPVKRILTILVGTLLTGLIAGEAVASGHGVDVAGLVIVFLPIAMWKRPSMSPVVLCAAALLIEQVALDPAQVDEGGGLVTVQPTVPITDKIPLFHGLGSLHLEPADLLILFVFYLYMTKLSTPASRWWPRSQVRNWVLALFAAVIYGLVVGIFLNHGSMRESFQEVRPYIYLTAMYFLISATVRDRKGLRAILWTLVLCEIFKSLQGMVVYIETRHWSPRPQSILGHEEAYFMTLYLLLVLGMWMFDAPLGNLRKVATRALPLVLFADLLNDRRAAWLMLGGGLMVITLIGWIRRPEIRPKILRIVAVVGVVCAVYLPVFWNSTSTFGQPARAIKSAIAPDKRDASSDLYRIQEDRNLENDIKHAGPLGEGFGVMIKYALPIVDLRAAVPELDYIPHNDVLYILLRMGIFGGVAMWGLIGAGIIAGCRLTKVADREIMLIGALLACAMVAYALEGATDQGFYMYRIAFITGAILGLAEAARHIVAARLDEPEGDGRESAGQPQRVRPVALAGQGGKVE
jgi:O-Antigen ligase